MISTIDQLGMKHELPTRPNRVVCLVPSITELLCDLGLSDYVVGCTKFCIHPIEIKNSAVIVGGTKNVHLDATQALQPNLIIANKEENTKNDIVGLRKVAPVWVSDIPTVESAWVMIRAIGKIFGMEKKAEQIIKSSERVLSQTMQESKRVAYIIWRSPYMTIGGDTYIHDMLCRSGFDNVFGESQRYPELTVDDLNEKKPDVIFLSSEPFPFKEKHIAELKEELGDIPIVLVDGEYFSWYGSRVIHCKGYLEGLMMEVAKSSV